MHQDVSKVWPNKNSVVLRCFPCVDIQTIKEEDPVKKRAGLEHHCYSNICMYCCN